MIANTHATTRVNLSGDEIADFCRRNHIRKLSLFGSVLRDDYRDDISDIDVLVEFESGFVPGLRFFALQEELSHILGRPVDLNTPKFLSERFRHQILAEQMPLYVQA